MRRPALHADGARRGRDRARRVASARRSSGSASTRRRARSTSDAFYPDAVPCLTALRERGLLVGAVGNMGDRARGSASGRTWTSSPRPSAGASRSRRRRSSSASSPRRGRPAAEIAYVGDRVDNDVEPALAAGMVAVHVRRGPWGHLHEPPIEAIRIGSLDELPGELAVTRLPRRHRLRRARVRGRRAARARRRADRPSARAWRGTATATCSRMR